MISIHALLAESDPGRAPLSRVIGISIHALLAESDIVATYNILIWIISIHALLAESDALGAVTSPAVSNFYPRSPCGERPCGVIVARCKAQFLSTLSLRRATRFIGASYGRTAISIHALLAESDGHPSHIPWR